MEWIETFLDVLESKNFNATAENLGLTQSTVSHRIQKLEDALGERLFERGRAGATPSWAGLRFENTARNLIMEWSHGRQAISRGKTSQTHLRVGIQYDLSRGYAGQILEVLRALNPKSTIYVEVDYSQQMNRDIGRGALDFALLYTPSDQPAIHTAPLATLSYVMISPQARKLSEVVQSGYTFPNISPAFAGIHNGLHPHLSNPILQCGQSDAIAQFMRHLGGASYVISALADELCAQEGFSHVEGAPPIEQQVYLACHIRNRSRFASGHALKAFQTVL